MAKAAPKGKSIAAKTTQKKTEGPVAPKVGKTAVKAAKVPGKAAAVATKKTPVVKAGKKTTRKVSRGDQYYCGVCGLIVSVDETCGCVDACDIICCGEEMQARK
jgi:hypothetical protein